MTTTPDTPLDRVSGTMHAHFSDIDRRDWPWPHFTPAELACRHCGELYVHMPTMAYLERVRDLGGGHPVRVNSAHRCWLHNRAIGGAPASCHKKVACDLSTRGRDRAELLAIVRRAGAQGVGLYQSFIHTDLGRKRLWYGSKAARELWAPILETAK